MNSERPIEKLLRAFARKRRDQAGQGFELHPAARRLLQGEVARRYGRAGSAPAPRGWARFWPRVAFAAATLAVLVFAVVLVLPSKRNPEQPVSLAKSESAEPLTAQTRAAPAVAPARTTALDALADKKLSAPSVQLAASQPASPPPATAAPAGTPRLAREPFSNEELPGRAEAALAYGTKAGGGALNAPAAAPAAVPSAPAPAAVSVKAAAPVERSFAIGAKDSNRALAESEPKLALTESQAQVQPADRFASDALLRKTRSDADARGFAVREESAAQNWGFDRSTQRQSFANQIAGPTRARRKPDAAQAVLNSFQLEQRGPEIRIVDKDGSVYTGLVQAVPAAMPPATSGTTTVAARSAKTKPAASGEPRSAGSQTFGASPLAPSLNFTVRGTNVTMRQAVVFAGNLQQAPSVSVATTTNQGQSTSAEYRNQLQSPGQVQNQLLNSRLTGRARLANGAVVEINAVPAAGDAETGRK
jgi:hypothetical protein